ncbi:MAG: hypothetical protein [Olavius algarvensis Gamma 1 endosymbiont]|nr:MAG: hypothetical protein [Olavius algarvensis Gamma 1 endosymbiont]
MFPAGPASDSSPRRLRRKRNRKPDDLKGHPFWRKQIGGDKEAHLMPA